MSDSYNVEAVRKTQRGTVLCGSRLGYEGDVCFTLADICTALDGINRSLGERGKSSVGCIVSEGILVGRTGDSAYRDPVYRCEFSTSPRAEALSDESFSNLIFVYASELGEYFRQERMYIELDNVTHVLRRSHE